MEFEKVRKVHILQGIKDFKEKGFPDGFGPSSTYNLVHRGENYPPKAIMVYANFHAEDRTIEPYFKGGLGTDCFKALERNEFVIIKKEKKTMNEELYKLKQDFLDYWPLEKLQNMTLEEYTDTKRENSFCYWLEHITRDIGSIVGGSSYKFGIYKRNSVVEIEKESNRISDGEYAWFKKYGEDSKEQAFETVKDIIIKIAKASKNNHLKGIDALDLGNAYKWKIVFLYGDYNIIDIFNHNALKTAAAYLGYQEEDHSYQALNKYILSKKGDKDYFEFAKELWGAFSSLNILKSEFENWLKLKKDNDSAKVSSYLKAIDILISNFKIAIYNEDDIEILEELYKDLKLHQKDINGKYYYSRSKSYGKGGFYSAAVGAYLEFLKQRDKDQTDSSDEERLINILKEIGQHDSEKFYAFMEQILAKISVSAGDARISYSLPKSKKRIGLTIGQKLCTVIEPRKDKFRFRYFDTTNDEKEWLKEANSFQEMAKELNTIIISAVNELNKTNKTGFEAYSSNSLEKSLFDKDYKKQIFYKAFNKEIKTDTMSSDLNQILFGPPGTGKTYHTINEAIKIVDPVFYKAHKDNRDKLKERFQLLLLNSNNGDNGQIGFSTFHQSFSYEDFIEGIKPVEPKEDDKYLKYKIQEGVFKKICRLANDSLKAGAVNSDSLISLTEEDFDKSHFYKMSLGNSQEDEDQDIFDYCIENNCLSIGFGESLDFTGKDEKELKIFGKEKGLKNYPIQAINLFKNYLKINNYVVISKGNNYVRAIGKVVGEYEYIEESPFPNNSTFNHFRKVEWIFNDKEISVNEIYNKNLSQQTIYKLIKNEIKKDFFVKEKKVENLNLPKNPKNFVLIIDEINRGNVSSIFGELITLIEKDKRAGGNEELSVLLPYSKKEFKVPQNVYIIGTMNTADRSIEALDTALRRRFSFREMPPKHQLISTVGKLKYYNGKIGEIDVVRILEVINHRIEKLIDKDHKIGHSYFLSISSENELKEVFKDKVIPLLEEYFFGDFGKISLILGSSFITKETKSDVKFARTNEYDASVENDLLERSVYEVTDQVDWDFKAIYE